MHQATLILNAGSSSIKFAVYTGTEEPTEQWRGRVEGIGTDASRLIATHNSGGDVDHELEAADHKQAFRHLLAWLENILENTRLYAVGHRVAHGGNCFTAPTRVTPKVLQQLEDLCSLAPLHQPHNLQGIKLLTALRPQVPQVACFDTAFHQSMPLLARMFALPREITASDVCRYGFHGLSYEYIANVLPRYLDTMPKARVVVAHLGHGASLCALHEGVSIATTMSFSPLDGIPMATRSGALDPSVVFYLQRNRGMTIDDIEHMLNHRAGLLGVSGLSADMRDLIDSSDPDARLAIDLFVYHVVGAIGSLAAALGGLDALVFSAGIGERATSIRERICRRCDWLGLRMDAAANTQHGPCISEPESPVSAWVIRTNEELMIARHTLHQVQNSNEIGA